VDVYINPYTYPAAVNETWNTVGAEGLVWGIGEYILPLNPGEEMILELGDEFFWGDDSYVEWPIEPYSIIYAQVDSYDLANDYGAVNEDHEMLDGYYNNIFGPILSICCSTSESDDSLNLSATMDFPILEGQPLDFESLPER